ncbi:hypothetical protein GF406_25110 [candidate division KSB1 bacterium]|nr:hypothetical protein [candidate division KSB1 bacterium]
MDLIDIDSFIDVKPYWLELNRTYKTNELALDYELYDRLRKLIYQPKNILLKTYCGFKKHECIAVFPFKIFPPVMESVPPPSLGEEAIIAREYFCPPRWLSNFISCLPLHTATDMSCFYAPQNTSLFGISAGNIVDIKSTESEYYYSLTHKHRHYLQRNYRENSDITVKSSDLIWSDEIAELKEKYIQYWTIKNLLRGFSDQVDSREKIEIDFLLLQRASEMGKLIALYFYYHNRLVAANFSVRREINRVDDYLCLRDTGEWVAHKSLGVYAILKNIEVCRSFGIRYYDLSDFISDYKRKFVNTRMVYYYPHPLVTKKTEPDFIIPERVTI